MASLGTSLTPTPFHSDETATECLMKLCLFHHCAQGEGSCWEGTQGPGQGSSHPRIGRKPSEWILEGDSQSPRGREAFAGTQQSCWNLYLCLHTKTPEPCAGFSHSAQHTEDRISAMKQWNPPFPVLPEPLRPEKIHKHNIGCFLSL